MFKLCLMAALLLTIGFFGGMAYVIGDNEKVEFYNRCKRACQYNGDSEDARVVSGKCECYNWKAENMR